MQRNGNYLSIFFKVFFMIVKFFGIQEYGSLYFNECEQLCTNSFSGLSLVNQPK